MRLRVAAVGDAQGAAYGARAAHRGGARTVGTGRSHRVRAAIVVGGGGGVGAEAREGVHPSGWAWRVVARLGRLLGRRNPARIGVGCGGRRGRSGARRRAPPARRGGLGQLVGELLAPQRLPALRAEVRRARREDEPVRTARHLKLHLLEYRRDARPLTPAGLVEVVGEPLAAQVAHRLVQVRRQDSRGPERAPRTAVCWRDALEGDCDGLGRLA